MSELNEKVTKIVNESMDSINNILRNKSDQFLIVGLDEIILNSIVYKMMENKKYKHVIVNSRDLNPNNKIFYIYLKNINSLEYQTLLYYYLELPLNNNCFICFLTTSSNCLSFFEKRVRSRFNNRIIFVPGLELNSFNVEKKSIENYNFNIYKSLESIENIKLAEKYDLNKFTSENIYSFFTPVHFVLIYISYIEKIIINDCYSQFQKTVKNIPEIKKVNSFTVVNCLQDLLGFGIINYCGKFVWDYNEYKNYLSKNAPLYLKKLLTNKYF